MARVKVAVMFGGMSVEHQVSVISALQAILAIDAEQYEVIPVYLALNGKWYTGDRLLERDFYRRIPAAFAEVQEITLLPDPSIQGLTQLMPYRTIPVDVCLLCFHGRYGEDGCVQGLLELAGIPFAGPGVLASALAMDKAKTKAVVQREGVPLLPHVLVRKRDVLRNLAEVRQKVVETLAFPLFVKPNHLGSSIAIARAQDERQLDTALAKVFAYDDEALVEPCIDALLELNVAILDDDPPLASLIEIPIASRGALSFEDKYMREGSKSGGEASSGMAGLTRIVDPKEIPSAMKQQVVQYALTVFQALGCSGVCRLDFMYDQANEKLYFNEINPIPGSLSFYLWDRMDPPLLYTDLIDRMLQRAIALKNERLSLKESFEELNLFQ